MQLTTIVQTTASPVSSFLFQHMCYLNLETLTSRFDVIILLPSSSRANPTLGHGCPNETTPRLQAVRSCARCQAEKRPMFDGFRSASTLRVHVCADLLLRLFQSRGWP